MLNELFWKSIGDYDKEITGVFRDPHVAAPIIEYLMTWGDGCVVADLGCGVGQSFTYLAGARQVYAVDANIDMLDRAQKASQEASCDIRFLEADLADYRLPEQADLSLLLSSFFPDGLEHAIRILDNVRAQTQPGGHVLMVLPSMESLLYGFHLNYQHRSQENVPEEEIYSELHDSYTRILTYGYFHNLTGRGHGQMVKFWVKEELTDFLEGLRFKNISFEKHQLPWEVYFPHNRVGLGHSPQWFWKVTMVNP